MIRMEALSVRQNERFEYTTHLRCIFGKIDAREDAKKIHTDSTQ